MSKTAGVQMSFKNETTGETWTKTLSGMSPTKMSDTSVAAAFCDRYDSITDGKTYAAKLITTEDVDLDS